MVGPLGVVLLYFAAMYVLKFFYNINNVFLQDSPAMLIIHPWRMEESPLLKSIPVFRSALFTKYLVGEMKTALHTTYDPLERRIAAIVHGLLKWQKIHLENFQNIHLGINELK